MRERSSLDEKYLRYPHKEQRYKATTANQELILLSENGKELVPNSSSWLQRTKGARAPRTNQYIRPVMLAGSNAKHKLAESLQLRGRTFGSTDEVIIPFLYLPTGWPTLLLLLYAGAVLLVPIWGSALVHGIFKIASLINAVVWSPIKFVIRRILIKQEQWNQGWIRYMAPPHYLKTRSTWKMPVILRNHPLEDIPPEVAYKIPINKIDYTMFVLTKEDYEKMDLGMDELEYIDEMLQFRHQDPKTVAELLRFRLGLEKFYYYFDEDILSDDDESEADATKKAEPREKTAAESEYDEEMDSLEYRMAMELDESWMHEEFDETFVGSPTQLDEIRKRREVLQELRDEIAYLRKLIKAGSRYEQSYVDEPVERRIRLQNQTRKLMERFLRFSNKTKERIAEVEPSLKTQMDHSVALSKYLPVVNKLSHYNHKLNVRHEKMFDPKKREIQLDIFGGP